MSSTVHESKLNSEQQQTLNYITESASEYALKVAQTAKSLIDEAVKIKTWAQTARQSGLVDDHIALLYDSKQAIHNIIDDGVTLINGTTGGDFFETLNSLHDVAVAGVTSGLDSDIQAIVGFDDGSDDEVVDLDTLSEGDDQVLSALILVAAVIGFAPHSWAPISTSEGGAGIRVFLTEDSTHSVDVYFVRQ